ncbi:MAG TPA: SdrD B-like domain-containing protein [Actinomycetota bacterium]|nr:SdrD B-like domain-containing protein [Actinomycetota bacterium]
MNRESYVKVAAVVLLLVTLIGGLQLIRPAAAPAAAGDIDLEVTATGVPNPGVLGLLGPYIDWTVTVTNSTGDEVITTTATGITVRDDINVTPTTLTALRQTPTVTAGSYNGSGSWTIPSLAPGGAATLKYRTQFLLSTTTTIGILSTEVTAAGQNDRDSRPLEDNDVGDQDDEAVFRTGSGTNRTVGNLVWNDLDANARYATSEPGVRGVIVQVTSGGVRLFAGRTNSSGAWSYNGVPTGTTITVTFLAPPESLFTTSKVGDDLADSDPVPATAMATSATTAARLIAADNPNIDAGVRINADLSLAKTGVPGTGSTALIITYTGRLTNAGPGPGAGIVVEDDLPVGVTLVGTPTVSAGVVTSSSNRMITWSVPLIAPGATETIQYQLRLPGSGRVRNQIEIIAATTPDFDSAPVTGECVVGQDNCTVVEVVVGTGELNGSVWRDANGNGQRDGGEAAQAGVTVRRYSPGGTLQASTTTGTDGRWAFSLIPLTDYIVEVVAPPGSGFTSRDIGSDSTDSDVDSSGRMAVGLAGATATIDAGLIRADSPVANRVLVPQGVPVTFNVLDDDAIPGRTAGGPLPSGYSWTRNDGPAWGSVTCTAAGSCTYTPLANHAGGDSFRYTVTNPTFGPATVTVAIEVLFVNDPPTARGDRTVTAIDTPASVVVTANDSDPNDPSTPGDPNLPGDPPRIASTGVVNPAGSGTASCSTTTCTFTPAPGFTGMASFGYTITDSGRSDPRVANAGVPGGIPALDPKSAAATVEVWVDPARRTGGGFRRAVEAQSTTGAGAWSSSTSAEVSASCTAGRPRAVLSWQTVSKVTGYRVERRPVNTPTGTDRWVEAAVVAAGTTSMTDTLVGEGQTLRYRVIPLRYRLIGQPSAEVSAAIPATIGPAGC